MDRRAVFIANKYYSDAGMDYVFARLQAELQKRRVLLFAANDLYAAYPFEPPKADFAVFWDKDIPLAKRLESAGIRLFNEADTIAMCDDKEKTFAAVSGVTELPATVAAPLVYDVSKGEDAAFLSYVERVTGYPIVVKECVGSQGRQVYLASNGEELAAWNRKLRHVPHVYQRYVRSSVLGADTRVYIVGQTAAGAVNRINTTDFRSNAARGGKMERTDLSAELQTKAETIARALRLCYGSVDFICEDGKYVFIEANSSPYMQNAETLGIPLAALYADYMIRAVYGDA